MPIKVSDRNTRPAPPSIALQVHQSSPKRDSTVCLERHSNHEYVGEAIVDCPGCDLDVRLRVRLELPFSFRGSPEDAPVKWYFFDLVVIDGSEAYYVVKCHFEDSHKSQPMAHIHQAPLSMPRDGNSGTTFRAGKRLRGIEWQGIDHTTPVAEAFKRAVEFMKVEAQYQPLISG